jgi:hypothetical protein
MRMVARRTGDLVARLTLITKKTNNLHVPCKELFAPFSARASVFEQVPLLWTAISSDPDPSKQPFFVKFLRRKR